MAEFKQGTFTATGFRWAIENQKEFERALDRYGTVASDFRPAFITIASDFYRSNRKLFTNQNAGLYEDLAPNPSGFPRTTSDYKKQKARTVGFVYPILVGKTRKLSNSILGKRNFGSVYTLRQQELLMGTSETQIPYARVHQSDEPRRKIAQRKFVFIDGGPADRSSDSSINGRRERWLNIVNDQVLDALGALRF